MKDERMVRKANYRIGEVSELVGVEPHVLRFWEREFGLKTRKSSTNHRLYSQAEIERFSQIKNLLYAERYTIEGARQRLRGKAHERQQLELPFSREEYRSRLQTMRRELLAIRELLLALEVTVDPPGLRRPHPAKKR